MKRSIFRRNAGVLALALALVSLVAVTAYATPSPNSAVIRTRIYDDCPFSILNVTNLYPGEITISDSKGAIACSGFANRHDWTFSENGVNPALFNNGDAFFCSTNLVINGEAEAGLRINPWWSETDGQFNVRSTDGEIACFGGRMPFFSFTATYGLRYTKGDPINLEIIYFPNALSATNPATIEYRLTYHGTNYSSGPLKFDQGNPAEDPPHGLWGILNGARVGGFIQLHWFDGPSGSASFTNIQFGVPSAVALDVKPGSCDNAIGVNSNGMLSVAILGSADLDVSQIDVRSIRLEGVAAKKGIIEDVTDATTSACDACVALPADSYPDLTLKFMTSSVLAALGPLTSENIVLHLTGSLTTGVAIEGMDCAVVKGNLDGGGKPTPGFVTLSSPSAPVQVVQYSISAQTQVRLSVYSVTGRLVRELVQEVQGSGTHTASWDVSQVPSGVYFYQFKAGDHEETAKTLIVR
jgi:type IX secretion system substrate protein